MLLLVEHSALNAWTADLTVEQVQAAQSFKPDLQAWSVATRKIPGTVLGWEMWHPIAQTGILVFANEFANRVAFAESLTVGQSICEYAPRSAGTAEIIALHRRFSTLANPSKSFMHTPLARPSPVPTAELGFIKGRRAAKRFICNMDPELHERLKE